MSKKPASLFLRTGMIVGITLFCFQIFILLAIIVFLLLPVVKSSANTMAATIIMSAENWLQQAPQTRHQFTQALKKHYNFVLYVDRHPQLDTTVRPHEPYLFYLEDALGEQVKQLCRFYADRNQADIYWVEFRYKGHNFDVAVPLHQLRGQPHAVIITILISGLLLTLVCSWFLAYHLTKPINRLVGAVRQVSRGILSDSLPETGCKELVVLAKGVNTMAKKVDELLENRTVMLAGISHDLRTPLTRMALSIEMLPEENDRQLTQFIRQDIALMNEMIGHYMELACCLTEEKPEKCDIHTLLQHYIDKMKQHSAVSIELNAVNTPLKENELICIYPVAFERIIINLLENAIRYGEGQPVRIQYETLTHASYQQLQITISDHGPGIPEEEIEKVFRPFYRVEKSRNTKSGGSGLGLAIVSHLAQARGWVITLRANPGGGLLAQLTIPIDT